MIPRHSVTPLRAIEKKFEVYNIKIRIVIDLLKALNCFLHDLFIFKLAAYRIKDNLFPSLHSYLFIQN